MGDLKKEVENMTNMDSIKEYLLEYINDPVKVQKFLFLLELYDLKFTLDPEPFKEACVLIDPASPDYRFFLYVDTKLQYVTIGYVDSKRKLFISEYRDLAPIAAEELIDFASKFQKIFKNKES